MTNANLETIIIEVDSDLLREVEEILMPYGLTPEDAAVLFLKFCVHPATIACAKMSMPKQKILLHHASLLDL